MGDPRKTKKHFERPLRLWDKETLEAEKALMDNYGLKNKRELWRIKTMLSKKRKSSRQLLALPLDERVKREKDLLHSLARFGLLDENAVLDDILTLSTDALLERRLQTLVWRKGLANTAGQARQFITHGHIAVNGKRVSSPGYLVGSSEENKISYYGKKMELKPKVQKKQPAEPREAEEVAGEEEKQPAKSGEEEKQAAEPKEEKKGANEGAKKGAAEKTAEEKPGKGEN